MLASVFQVTQGPQVLSTLEVQPELGSLHSQHSLQSAPPFFENVNALDREGFKLA